MKHWNLKYSNTSFIIRDSIFEECLSDLGSCCVYITSAQEHLYIMIDFTSLDFINCRAEIGSAIFISSLVKISQSNIQNTRIVRNYNTSYGPIHSTHLAGNLRVTDCTFFENKGDVAAISVLFSKADTLLSLNNIQVLDNECIFAGVYLQSLSNSAKVITESVSIYYNSCPGLYLNNLSVIDNNSKIHDNLTGIKLENNARLKMFHAQISYNTSAKKGVGVYVQSYSLFSCTDCIISHNRAYIGAGIMLGQEASVLLTRTQLSNNYAVESGSAIYLKDCSSISYIEDCDISSNTSD